MMAVGSLPAPDPELGGIVGSHDGTGLRIGLVAARWNIHLTGRLLDGAKQAFAHCNIAEDDTLVAWAPGSFELPTVCRRLAASGRFDAVVALGAVVRGETTHYELVSEGAAEGILRATLDTGVPVIFGLITTETEEQALARAGDDHTNKGFEGVVTAVEMATLLRQLPSAPR